MPRVLSNAQEREQQERAARTLKRGRRITYSVMIIVSCSEFLGIVAAKMIFGGHSLGQMVAVIVVAICLVRMHQGMTIARRALSWFLLGFAALGARFVFSDALLLSGWWIVSVIQLVVRLGGAAVLLLPSVAIFVEHRRQAEQRRRRQKNDR